MRQWGGPAAAVSSAPSAPEVKAEVMDTDLRPKQVRTASTETVSDAPLDLQSNLSIATPVNCHNLRITTQSFGPDFFAIYH